MKLAFGLSLAAAALLVAGAGAFGAVPPEDGTPAGGQGGARGHAGGHGTPVENSSTGTIEGSYVSLSVPGTDTLVANYAAEDVLYLDAVVVPGNQLSNTTFDNSLLLLTGTRASAEVHDTPSATLRVLLEAGAQATLLLAEGMTATIGTNGTINVSGGTGNETAAVWSNCGPGSMSTDAAGGEVLVMASKKCHLFFRTHAAETVEETLIDTATETQAVAAEIDVAAEVSDAPSVTTYSDAVVTATYAEGVVEENVTEAVITVRVKSPMAEPKSIVVRYEAPEGATETTVFVDGMQIRAAEDLADALNPNNDAGAFEYSFSSDGDRGVVVVSMPETSSHVVEVRSAVGGIVPPAAVPIFGAAIGISVVLVATGLMFRRGRR